MYDAPGKLFSILKKNLFHVQRSSKKLYFLYRMIGCLYFHWACFQIYELNNFTHFRKNIPDTISKPSICHHKIETRHGKDEILHPNACHLRSRYIAID